MEERRWVMKLSSSCVIPILIELVKPVGLRWKSVGRNGAEAKMMARCDSRRAVMKAGYAFPEIGQTCLSPLDKDVRKTYM